MFVDKVHITIYKMFVGSDKIRNSLSTNTIYKHLSPALSTNITYKQIRPIYKHYLQTADVIYKRPKMPDPRQKRSHVYMQTVRGKVSRAACAPLRPPVKCVETNTRPETGGYGSVALRRQQKWKCTTGTTQRHAGGHDWLSCCSPCSVLASSPALGHQRPPTATMMPLSRRTHR